MRLYQDYRELVGKINGAKRVVTIGNFDGVHNGHRSVIAKGLSLAKELSLEYAICTFEPHPSRIFRPQDPLLRLTTRKRKLQILEEIGVPLVLAQKFDRAFAALSDEEFVRKVLVEALDAQLVIIGENFRYGKGRQGDLYRLKEMGIQYGFDVLGETLVDDGSNHISSSRIRKLIAKGELEHARDLLGRFHEVPGDVIRGKGVGTGLGFPTINLGNVEVLLPPNGIYAAICDLGNERKIKAAVYIGERPTLGHGKSLEAHLLDFSEDLYHREVVVQFVSMLRSDIKFASVAALQKQMTLDITRVREILENQHV